LSVDEKVVRGAKRYAAARRTSVSQLVERYLALLSNPTEVEVQPPVLKLLRGAARGASSEAHRRHLSRNTGEVAPSRPECILDVILDRRPDADAAAALWVQSNRARDED